MLVYMMHDQHGVHPAYSEDEVKSMELHGWYRKDSPKPEVIVERKEDPPVITRRRGRPPKAK